MSYTLKQAREMDQSEFNALSEKEMREVIRTMSKGLNRNIDRLTKAGIESPALEQLKSVIKVAKDRGKLPDAAPDDRISSKGLNRNQLETMFSAAKKFSSGQTSNMRGAKLRISRIEESLGKQKYFKHKYTSLTDDQKSAVFDAYRRLDTPEYQKVKAKLDALYGAKNMKAGSDAIINTLINITVKRGTADVEDTWDAFQDQIEKADKKRKESIAKANKDKYRR